MSPTAQALTGERAATPLRRSSKSLTSGLGTIVQAPPSLTDPVRDTQPRSRRFKDARGGKRSGAPSGRDRGGTVGHREHQLLEFRGGDGVTAADHPLRGKAEALGRVLPDEPRKDAW